MFQIALPGAFNLPPYLQQIASPGAPAAPAAPDLGGPNGLHLLAARGDAAALDLLLQQQPACRELLNAPTRPPLPSDQQPPELQSELGSLNSDQTAALAPGMTSLAIAARLGHLECVRLLLRAGADPNAAGPPAAGHPKPFTPLSAVVLTPDASFADSMLSIAELLLRHGADPLAPSVRRTCSTLRCACGSEFVGNGCLALLLDHLEGLHAAGRLAFGSGDAAADVMVAAARCRRVRLFLVAHEFVLGAAGLRWKHAQAAADAAAATRAARAPAAAHSDDSSSGSGSSSSDGSDAESAGAGCSDDNTAELVWQGFVPPKPTPAWQPSAVQLFEAVRGAALGGSLEILRALLSSPLEIGVPEADAAGNGLMAHCAALSGSPQTAEAVRLLHSKGARLDLQRLLYVLEKTVDPAAVAALLACERPVVALQVPTLKACGLVSFSCPIHRLLHIWKRGPHTIQQADPSGWPRRVMLVLEVLLGAGYRPAVYRGMAHPVAISHAGKLTRVAEPFDPFDFFPEAGPDDGRLLLVARGGQWDTATHRLWPQRFKQAVQALLLSAHRLSGTSSFGPSRRAASRAARAARREARSARAAGLAGVGAVPQEVLLHIVGAAAWPMSDWM